MYKWPDGISYKVKGTGTIHAVSWWEEGVGRTACGLDITEFVCGLPELTYDKPTCKNCLKVLERFGYA